MIDLSKKIETSIGQEIQIAVPIPMYIGGIKGYRGGALLKFNKIDDRDLDCGNFIRLKGYNGTFRIARNDEAWDGLYHLKLIREDIKRKFIFFKRTPLLKKFLN